MSGSGAFVCTFASRWNLPLFPPLLLRSGLRSSGRKNWGPLGGRNRQQQTASSPAESVRNFTLVLTFGVTLRFLLLPSPQFPRWLGLRHRFERSLEWREEDFSRILPTQEPTRRTGRGQTENHIENTWTLVEKKGWEKMESLLIFAFIIPNNFPL